MKQQTKTSIIELTLSVGALLLGGLYFRPEDPMFIHSSLNPYWAVLLLISLRYGTPMSTVTGALCACLYLVGLSWHGISLHRLLNLNIQQALYPLMFVGGGAIIGSTIQLNHRKQEDLKEDLRNAKHTITQTEAKRLELDNAYRSIERRIAGQTQTLTDFSDNLKQLDQPKMQTIYTTLIEILNKQMHTTQCEIWEQTKEGRYCQILGTQRTTPLPRLGQEVLRTRRVMTICDMLFAEQDCGPDDGVIAGPLYNNEVNIIAVVVIRSIPFKHLSYSVLSQFETYLEWASRSLTTVFKTIVDDATIKSRSEIELMPSDQFVEFCHTELDMIAGQTTSSFMFCRVGGRIAPDVKERLNPILGRIIRYQTHLHDAIMWHEPSETFMIFLPATPPEVAATQQQRLEYYVSLFEFHPYGDNTPLQLNFSIIPCSKSSDIQDAIVMLREGEVNA